MTGIAGLRRAAVSFPYGKAALLAVGGFYLYAAASSIGTTDGSVGLSKVVVLALAPLCVFFALRFPVVFPFGAYVMLAPFDTLFSVSGGASLVRLIGFAVFGALLLRMLRLRRFVAPPPGWYFWGAWLLYNVVSLLWTADLDGGMYVTQTFLQLFAMMSLLAIYPITRRELNVIIVFVIIGGLTASASAAKTYFLAGGVSDTGRVDFTHDGFSLDPNYFAGGLISPLALASAGIFFMKRGPLRSLCIAMVPAFLAAVFLAGSREVVIAAAGVFVFVALRSPQRLAALAIGAASLSTMLFFPTLLTRFFSGEDPDGSGRAEIWKVGLHNFSDHWLFGTGAGSYGEIYDRNVLQTAITTFVGWHRPAHSIAINSLTETGIVGSVLLLAAWVVSFRQMKLIPKTSGLYGMRVAFEAAIIGLGIQAFFITPMLIKYVWLALTLPMMLLTLYAPRTVGFGEEVLQRRRWRPASAFRGR